MRATDLLRSIDHLPHGQRLRSVALEGRRLRGTAELRELLGELSRGTAFERTLGLVVAQVAGEVDYVTRLLRDPVPSVQQRALAAVRAGVPVSDDDLRILYDDAPAELRTKLMQVIRKNGRTLLAARLIDEHRERWGDRAAASLLNSTDDQTVERLLPELAYCLGSGEWRRLGAKHPKVVLAYASTTLPTGPDKDEWWQGPAYGVVGVLDRDPSQAAALLTTALPPDQLPTAIVSVLGRLIDADPGGVLAILLGPDRAPALGTALTTAVRRRLHRYSDDDLIGLGRLLWPDLTQLLEDLPPSRRATVFTPSPAASTWAKPFSLRTCSPYCPASSGLPRPAAYSRSRRSRRTTTSGGGSLPSSRTTKRSRCSSRRSAGRTPTIARRSTGRSSTRPVTPGRPQRSRARCRGRRAYGTIATSFGRGSCGVSRNCRRRC